MSTIGVMTATPSFSQNKIDENEVIVITPVIPEKERMPQEVPISGWYCPAQQEIQLAFDHNMGLASVEITNTATGASTTSYVATATGTASIPVGNQAGTYEILITTSAGQFYGMFIIN